MSSSLIFTWGCVLRCNQKRNAIACAQASKIKDNRSIFYFTINLHTKTYLSCIFHTKLIQYLASSRLQQLLAENSPEHLQFLQQFYQELYIYPLFEEVVHIQLEIASHFNCPFKTKKNTYHSGHHTPLQPHPQNFLPSKSSSATFSKRRPANLMRTLHCSFPLL